MIKRYLIYSAVAIILYVIVLVLHKLINYDIMSFVFFYMMITAFDTNHRLYELEDKGK